MDVTLELMNGQRIEATLSKPFNPEDNEVDLLIGITRKKQTYLFPDICSVLLKSHQNWMHLMKKGTSREMVTTAIGKTYCINVPDKQSYATGFFGLTEDEKTPRQLIFFTNVGVKNRCQTLKLGEIVKYKGMVSPESVQKTLEEQEKLRNRLIGEIIADEAKLPQSEIENTFEAAKKSWNLQLRPKIGNILITAGLVTQEQVNKALEHQEQNKKKKTGELLVELGFITEDQLLTALAMKFRLKMIDLTETVPEGKALAALPLDVVRRLQVLPIMDKGDRLIIATSQPTDYSIYENLQFYTGRKIEMVVTSSQQISEAIEKYFPTIDAFVNDLIGDWSVDHEADEEEDENEEPGVSESDSQIVNLVNKILMDGYGKGASDIHFEPGVREQPFQVRYRIDGICQLMHQIQPQYKKAIISRLKIMANLDITERRRPQSGKILLKFKNYRVEYRVEITPTTGYNEDAVLRVLAASEPVSLDKMGFSPSNEKAFRAMLSQPYGIILCVGPTGSGKTTTLHSALGHLNTQDRKIWTVEDPVEITQPGLRQVQVQSRIGLTFAEVLRSFLRADPDIIMIGEMRDKETAKTAIEASLTGHLVLSTLHTNSAPETLVRLIEMDMDPYNFADALLGILAQRLTRRLCDNCKILYHPSEEEFAGLVHLYDPYWFEEHKMEPYSQETMLTKKRGCEKCNGSGYRGRIALHELIVGTENVKRAIKKGTPAEEIKVMAIQEGMRTLLMDGMQKILLGLTDLSNVLKVCASQKVELHEL